MADPPFPEDEWTEQAPPAPGGPAGKGYGFQLERKRHEPQAFTLTAPVVLPEGCTADEFWHNLCLLERLGSHCQWEHGWERTRDPKQLIGKMTFELRSGVPFGTVKLNPEDSRMVALFDASFAGSVTNLRFEPAGHIGADGKPVFTSVGLFFDREPVEELTRPCFRCGAAVKASECGTWGNFIVLPATERTPDKYWVHKRGEGCRADGNYEEPC